jgi:HK97 family phage prohead protease
MGQLDELRQGAVQFRAAVIEDVDTEKSEMFLKAVPYGQPTDIGGGIIEEFKPGTFARAANAPHRLTLWRDHGGAVIGRGLEVEERAEGVWLRMKLSRTSAAKDALLDVEDGIAADPSVEFRPQSEWMDVTAHAKGLTVVHRRAHLLGCALVVLGAYSGSAYVESIREEEQERAVEAERAWLLEYRRRSL